MAGAATEPEAEPPSAGEVDALRKKLAALSAMYAALRDEDIEVQMISQGASKVNISLVVSAADVTRAVQALHRCFFLPGSEPTWQ